MFERSANRLPLMGMRTTTENTAEWRGEQTRGWATLRDAGMVLAGTAVIAAAAHIAIPLPFTPVPFTLQPLAVLLVGLLFGPIFGFVTLCLYLAEGLAGLPVFQPLGLGGMAQLLGPTGGFLLAYPLVAALAGGLSRTVRFGSSYAAATVAGTVATLLLFALGAARLGSLLHLGIRGTLMAAVLPFLPGEAVKVLAAAGIASAWKNRAR